MKNTLKDHRDDRNTSVTERLVKFLALKRVTRKEFYDRTGIGKGAIDKKGGMTSNSIEKVSDEWPDLNLFWLIKGVGDAIVKNETLDEKNQSPESLANELLEAYRKINKLEASLKESDAEVTTLNQELRIRDAHIHDLRIQLKKYELKKDSA